MLVSVCIRSLAWHWLKIYSSISRAIEVALAHRVRRSCRSEHHGSQFCDGVSMIPILCRSTEKPVPFWSVGPTPR